MFISATSDQMALFQHDVTFLLLSINKTNKMDNQTLSVELAIVCDCLAKKTTSLLSSDCRFVLSFLWIFNAFDAFLFVR